MTRAFVLLLLVALNGCVAPLRMIVGGDLNLGPRSDRVLEPLRLQLQGDLRICNLEGPLIDGCVSVGESLCAPTSRALALRNRIDVAVLENNHAADQGERGHDSTVRALRGVGVIGAGSKVSFERRGRSVTLLSRVLAPGALPAADLLDQVRRTHGIVLISLHWGQTGSLQPSAAQRTAARQLIDAGATAVLGHGPHTVQPVERYRHGVIAYSLGNLAFECDCSVETDSFLLAFVVDRRGHAQEVRLHPIQAGVKGAPSYPSAEPELLRLLQEIHAGLGIATVLNGAELIVSPTRGD